MTQARPWPNLARAQRDETLMQATRGARALRPLVEGQQVPTVEAQRRVAVALDSLDVIQVLMVQAGAPGRDPVSR